MEYDCLIDGGILLTLNRNMDTIENGALLIKDKKIKDIGPAGSFDQAFVKSRILAHGKIIMPGLVNCHTHIPMSMFRGLADDLPLDVWLNEHIFPAEAARVNPESVAEWAAHSCKEMLLSGTTTFCDGYFLEKHAVPAVINSGMRAVLGQGVVDFPAPGVPEPKGNVQAATEFVRETSGVSSLISPSIFCHSPYTCSKETLISAKKKANELDVLFQIHVAETRNEVQMIQGLDGRSVIKYLDDLEILDEKTLIVHAVWIDGEDMAIIRRRGCGVVHCPESNMKLASGIAPAPEMINLGIPVGLGTDGCASNNDHDLMAEMDTAAKLHKVAQMDPCVMDARTTLRSATIEGARAIGLASKIGSLEPGKCADIILLDVSKPHAVPMTDPYSALVYSLKASDVSWVLVDGKVLVKDGELI